MIHKLSIKSMFMLCLVTIAFLIVSYSVFITYTVREALENDLITRGKTEIAAMVHMQTVEHIPEAIFSESDTLLTQKAFDAFFKQIDTAEVLRIKVWDKHGRIIAANDPAIVGNVYADNVHFLAALAGNIPVDIKKPLSPENASEKGYGQLMEVYVPIQYSQGSVVGVVEIYTILDHLNAQIQQTRGELIRLVVGTSIPLLGILGVLFYFLYNNLYKRIRTLITFTRTIGKGEFTQKLDISAHDEIADIALAINRMTDELKTSIVTKEELQKQINMRTSELEAKIAEVEALNKFLVDHEVMVAEMKQEIARLKEERGE